MASEGDRRSDPEVELERAAHGPAIAGRNRSGGAVRSTLVALVSLLLAESMPDWGRDVFYGCAILGILLLYGREKREA